MYPILLVCVPDFLLGEVVVEVSSRLVHPSEESRLICSRLVSQVLAARRVVSGHPLLIGNTLIGEPARWRGDFHKHPTGRSPLSFMKYLTLARSFNRNSWTNRRSAGQ